MTLIPKPAPYDVIADIYDEMFDNPAARQENAFVMNRLRYAGETVLDVGCGSGLLLDCLGPLPRERYLGIDPSARMLERLRAKHPGNDVICTTLEDLWQRESFGLVVGLFGSPSYVSPDGLRRIPHLLRPGGRFFLMLYADDYFPVTYALTGLTIPHHRHRHDVVPGTASALRWGNYIIVEGHK